MGTITRIARDMSWRECGGRDFLKLFEREWVWGNISY